MSDQSKTKGLMQHICEFIVDKRLLFIVVFIAALVFSVFSVGWVSIENDIAEYLPPEAEAKRGLNIMAEEFTTFGTAQILIEDTGYYRVLEYVDRISKIDGVMRVEFDASENHYKDGAALIDITFSWPTENRQSEAALDNVRSVLSNIDYHLYSEIGNSLTKIVISEMGVVVILVAIVVVAVLIFTSGTYMEIPVLLITFIVAAAINMGTHFLLGTISFISDAVAIVLQLALSVDYAIILCNRYKEEHLTLPIRDAAIKALRYAMPEIAASSLTTIAGLTAMTFMKFRLGFDMGISLIKSIICSLLTVFLLMPGLLVIFGKAMDKTKHRNFVPKISFVGKYAYATRYFVPVLFLALVLGANTIFSGTRFAYCEKLIHTTKLNTNQVAENAIKEHFGEKNVLAILVPAGDYGKEAALIDELSRHEEFTSIMGLANIDAIDGYKLADEVNHIDFRKIAGVDDTMSQALFAYYAAENGEHNAVANGIDGYTVPLIKLFLFLHDKAETGAFELEEQQRNMIDSLYSQLTVAYDQLQSKRYSRIITTIALPYDDQVTYDFLDEIRSVIYNYYDDAVMVGESINAAAFNDTFDADNNTVSLISIALVMLILFFTFHSFGMPLLLILVIQGSIWINFAIARLSHSYVFFMVYLIVSAIQMGANIDYAIVISSRYSFERRCGDLKLASVNTMNFAFPTIITSGSMMVIAGLLVGLRVSEPTIAGIGLYVGTGTIISLVLVMFALPQILLLGDRFVQITTINVGEDRNKTLKFARTTVAVLLIAAALCSFFITPITYQSRKNDDIESSYGRTNALSVINQLCDLSDRLELERSEEDTAYSFAESFVTEQVGHDQLEEGQQLLEENQAMLYAGEAQYNAGVSKLEQAKAEYAAGEEKLRDGQAQYDAGKTTLDAAKAQYADGERQLQEAKAQYAEGEAALAAIKPLYDTVMPLYNTYQGLQAQYDQAVAAGDVVQASLLAPTLALAKASFETSLGSYSLSGIIQQYNDGQQKLQDGAAQIADAEAVLADAKAQIDAGQAELDAAKAVLDAGYAELDDAKAQIADGEAQLQAAKGALDSGRGAIAGGRKELEDGRKMLEENYADLLKDISDLNSYANDESRLRAGVELIADRYGIPLRAGDSADYKNVLTTAIDTINSQGLAHKQAAKYRLYAFAAALLCAFCAVMCVVLAISKSRRGSIAFALFSAVFSLTAIAIWLTLCGGGDQLFILSAVLLLILSAAYVLITASIENEDN